MPKAARKAVEQKWSFAEIVAALGRQQHPGIGGLKELAGYLHFYGNASHLLHADPVALDFMHDRAIRPPEEGALLAASHICRIYTDVVGLSYLCSDAIRVMLGREFADAQALHQSIVRCFELTTPVTSAFYETQAHFYRRHGHTEFSGDPVSG